MHFVNKNKVPSPILVENSPVHAPEPEEPVRTAKAVAERALGFCVVTMVTRDDLPDRGPWHILCILYLPCLGQGLSKKKYILDFAVTLKSAEGY